MDEEIWYLIVNGSTEGPFAYDDLLGHPGFDPDVLVWKDGMEGWTPAREVLELKELFEDKKKKFFPDVPTTPEIDAKIDVDGELVAEGGSEPPFLLIWFLVAALILMYLLFQIFN